VCHFHQAFEDDMFVHRLVEATQLLGIGDIFIATMIMVIPYIWIANRWVLPMGSTFLYFFLPISFMSVLEGGHVTGGNYAVYTAVFTGVAAEFMLAVLGRRALFGWKRYVFFTWIPLAMMSAHFLVIHLLFTVIWPPELWGGSIVMASLLGCIMSYFMPPHSVEPETK
jgi:hypothetical protein